MRIKNGNKYLILLMVGFCGMLVSHYVILILLGYGGVAGRNIPMYAFVYPVVYGMFAFILSRRDSEISILHPFALCIVPTLYWLGLLIYDGAFINLHISFSDNTSMLFVMPMTILIVMVVMKYSSSGKNTNSL